MVDEVIGSAVVSEDDVRVDSRETTFRKGAVKFDAVIFVVVGEEFAALEDAVATGNEGWDLGIFIVGAVDGACAVDVGFFAACTLVALFLELLLFEFGLVDEREGTGTLFSFTIIVVVV